MSYDQLRRLLKHPITLRKFRKMIGSVTLTVEQMVSYELILTAFAVEPAPPLTALPLDFCIMYDPSTTLKLELAYCQMSQAS